MWSLRVLLKFRVQICCRNQEKVASVIQIKIEELNVYFSVLGILLMIHGHHRGVVITLCLGAIELTFFICIVPGVYLGLRHLHRRRLKRKRSERMSRNVLKEKASFVNADPDVRGSPTSGTAWLLRNCTVFVFMFSLRVYLSVLHMLKQILIVLFLLS